MRLWIFDFHELYDIKIKIKAKGFEYLTARRTCNGHRIYESFHFWIILQKKINFITIPILIFWEWPVYIFFADSVLGMGKPSRVWPSHSNTHRWMEPKACLLVPSQWVPKHNSATDELIRSPIYFLLSYFVFLCFCGAAKRAY